MKKISEISESLWGKTLMRDIDDTERREDEQSPFFGEGIKYRFYEEDGLTHFTYQEALEIEKKEKGWRLPNEDDIRSLQLARGDGTIISQYGELRIPYRGVSTKDNRGGLRYTNVGYMHVKANNSLQRYELNDYSCRLCLNSTVVTVIPHGAISVCLIRDKVNESLWGKTLMRDIDDTEREEDICTDKFKFCNNYETSFKGKCPRVVKNDVDCHNTHCTNLEGTPRIVDGEFGCSNTQSLVSLKGCPKKIGGDFNFYSTSITEIDDFPEEIGGNINMSGCKNLKNFVGMSDTVNGDLDIGYCIIDNIDGLPSDIKGKLIISNISYRDTYEKNKKRFDDLKKEIDNLDRMRTSPQRRERRDVLVREVDRICDSMMYDVYYDIIKKYPHLKGKIYKSRFDRDSL